MKPRLCLLLLLCLPLLCAAQAAPSADDKAIYDYRLTMPKMQQFVQTYRNLAKAAEDPAVQAWVKQHEAEQDEEGRPAAQSLDEMVRGIEAAPPMVRAIRAAGMNPREFVLFTLAYFQAGFAHGLQQQGLLKELPPQIPKANVDFIAHNQAELRALQKELEVLERQLNPARFDDEDQDDEDQDDEEP